jgi:hypothetical protein
VLKYLAITEAKVVGSGWIWIHRKMRIKKSPNLNEHGSHFNSQLIKYRFIILWCHTKIIQRPPTDESMDGGHIKANDNGSMTIAPCVYRWSLGDFYVTTSNYIRHKEIKYAILIRKYYNIKYKVMHLSI